MDDVRGLFLGMPHGTTPAAVTTNKNIIMSSFKSSRDIQKKEGILINSSVSKNNNIYQKRNGYNLNVMRQSAC